MEIQTVAGISYAKPTVTLIQDSPLLVGELAGRIAYDSFANSEHEVIRNFSVDRVDELDADSSELLNSLAWVHHHHSVLEHLSLSYLIQGTSRGVLQETVRHRIASYTVRSTRYTMSSILNAFVASQLAEQPRTFFIDLLRSFDMFVTVDELYQAIEIDGIYSKLYHQQNVLGTTEFINTAIAKSSLDFVTNIKDASTLFNTLEAGKKKRNVGDAFKHIISDNVKVDMVVTMNLRSLKNYLTLRDSGAAFFQIRHLAQAIKDATPSKYIDLIIKA